MIITHRIFFIKVITKKIKLDAIDSFNIGHFLDSPNMAKRQNKTELKGFENKGYFELFAISNKKEFLVDRSSRKADLIKLQELLSKY